ncbi:zinc-finger domain-containing protein [Paracoccus seriniphilus]|uniref:zinc-finger domain-containing protein n=1 Tax=Paracoccus seriniphilus TaxID=184748 RepID=UPI000B77FF78|nr:zinc-finger domain-containing protein [Paracoccus seriniphilus]WCR15300.1 zinc-finger domain-containing protein [Paracoccus seriniphilus]
MKLPAPEEVIVTSRKVACDGNDAAGLGHPRVWLAISPDTGFVDCGYCDKRFVLDPNHVDADH